MPNPEASPVATDPQFDPRIHCGLLDARRMPCKAIAGYQTAHPGQGRCFQHDQKEIFDPPELSPEAAAKLAVTIPERNPRHSMKTFMDRVLAARDSDDLLTLDNEIAVLRVVIEDEIKQYVVEKAHWSETMDAIARGDYDSEGGDPNAVPQMSMPSLPLETMNTMQRLIKIAYDMRFAKRFSVPITELENVVNQIRNAFTAMCTKYKIPDEAKLDFARELMNIKLSQKTDWQLARAGGEDVPTMVGRG